MHDLAIIMPTRNRPKIAARSLRLIRAHFPEAPIYVFDDASDDAAGVVRATADIENCRLFRSDKNVGAAEARRRLIELADARWCLALDDDCHPRDDLDVTRWVQADPGVEDPIVICLRVYRSYDGDIAPPGKQSLGPCRTILGGASLLHRTSVIEIGNYHPEYIFGAEDTDLSRRVWASGRKIWIDPDAFVIHDHVPVGRDLRREAFFYVRNRILLNVLTLPLWFGLPLGLAQAVKRWLVQPYKFSGFLGLFAGIYVSARSFRTRRPLTLREYRYLHRLPS